MKLLRIVLFSLIAASSTLADGHTSVSPNSPWPENIFDRKSQKDEEPSLAHKIIFWLPNRLLDLVDVVKADVGAGPTYGGVVRVSKYAQVGFRSVSPLSVRVGLLGRQAPFLTETSSEIGASPAFVQSKDRIICPGEVGVGADLFIGAYGGICIDEAFDFLAGIFFIDLQHDDL